MKRAALTHKRVFSDEDDANEYASRHKKNGREVRAGGCREAICTRISGGRIIDVGCGFGATNIILAERFADSEIIGIDLSDPLLRLANQSAQAANLGGRVRFEKADVQRMPYEDNSFDVAINVNMVHLVEDPIRMLNEIERVLVPGGYLFIADLRRSWLGLIEREIRSGLTLAEARELFSRSALREGVFSSGFLWWRFEAGKVAMNTKA